MHVLKFEGNDIGWRPSVTSRLAAITLHCIALHCIAATSTCLRSARGPCRAKTRKISPRNWPASIFGWGQILFHSAAKPRRIRTPLRNRVNDNQKMERTQCSGGDTPNSHPASADQRGEQSRRYASANSTGSAGASKIDKYNLFLKEQRPLLACC